MAAGYLCTDFFYPTHPMNQPTNPPSNPTQRNERYIAYARKYVHPRLSREAAGVLQETYLRMRAEARLGGCMRERRMDGSS